MMSHRMDFFNSRIFFYLPLAAYNGKLMWSSSAVNTRDVYQHQPHLDH